ncbi:hypothetical protein H5410_038038 [Solanum commersonii]|uniref:Helicase C-terminal domain-containing protein n=1 Tax=Solanum commersonii TaxID=4109 RepID=A0A9J5YCT8_SOLCO|nr:hypothetical protein H5410_038038 [Solanum commersonii]
MMLHVAHCIKSIHNNSTKAVLALESFYKWALTGTPLQNHIGELYSVVRFLQVTPYVCYFCEDCNCTGLDFSFSDACPQCSHQPASHFLWWKKYIEEPSWSYDDEGRDAMVWLKHKILKSLLLRRTKKERAVDLALPTKTVTVRKDSLDDREYDYYKTLCRRSQAQLDMYAISLEADRPYRVMYSRKELASGNKEARDVEQSCDWCHDAVQDLELCGINCVQLVGSISIATRDAALKRFTEDANCKKLLMSLKAGGVALNLTVASHVFLMDPWWNPAVEQQAQDRVHRIGQYKPVKTIGGSSEALGKLTNEDLMSLLYHHF